MKLEVEYKDKEKYNPTELVDSIVKLTSISVKDMLYFIMITLCFLGVWLYVRIDTYSREGSSIVSYTATEFGAYHYGVLLFLYLVVNVVIYMFFVISINTNSRGKEYLQFTQYSDGVYIEVVKNRDVVFKQHVDKLKALVFSEELNSDGNVDTYTMIIKCKGKNGSYTTSIKEKDMFDLEDLLRKAGMLNVVKFKDIVLGAKYTYYIGVLKYAVKESYFSDNSKGTTKD